MINFKTRSQEKEMMDLYPLSPEETLHTYKLISRVNQCLGGIRVILRHLSRFSAGWKPGETIRVLDIGSGSADIPRAIVRWGRKRKQAVRVTALDLSGEALRMARGLLRDYPEIQFVQGSCFELPFSRQSYDYVISSMFFHHLADSEAAAALKSFDQIARRGIIINDLLRSRRAFWGIKLLAAFTGDKFFKNDAPLSVLRGFVRNEAGALIQNSGLSYLKFYRHFAYRFALAGEKTASHSRMVLSGNPQTYRSPTKTFGDDKKHYDAVIIGGGLAGPAAGIGLARKGWRVLIIEKQKQSHKVCGEFLAPSVWPVLKQLGAADAVASLGGTEIRSVGFSSGNGVEAVANLPVFDPAFSFGLGVSREALDACLLEKAREAGCGIACPAEAGSIQKNPEGYAVEFLNQDSGEKCLVQSRLVIKAAGRQPCHSRMILGGNPQGYRSPTKPFGDDSQLSRNGKIGFKAHFNGPAPDDKIRLFFFPGGYFGIVAIENNGFNLCGIVDKKGLQKYHANFDFILEETAKKNLLFRKWFFQASRTRDWITCASLVHGRNPPAEGGLFHAGDSACFLEPFMGQGMTMALAGGLLLAETLGSAPPAPGKFSWLQKKYRQELARLYRSRLSLGNGFQRLVLSGFQPSLFIGLFNLFPALLKFGIQKSAELPFPAPKEPVHVL